MPPIRDLSICFYYKLNMGILLPPPLYPYEPSALINHLKFDEMIFLFITSKCFTFFQNRAAINTYSIELITHIPKTNHSLS